MSYVVIQTETFAKWHRAMKDLGARVAIARRIERAQAGNLGDAEPIGDGVSEMRVHVGPGYRVYFTIRDRMVVILLVGGDKSTQQADIRKAITMAKEV